MLPETHQLVKEFRTLFCLRNYDRIERENDPDCSAGPKLYIAGCADGNIYGVRGDVPEDIAIEVRDLAQTEPPFTQPTTLRHQDQYLSLLTRDDGDVKYNFGLIYELPHSLCYRTNAQLIESDSAEGQKLIQNWDAGVVSAGLFELGFRSSADFWPPWCAAVIEGEVASLAFAARLSDEGAELGLVTAEAFRGRGFAASVVAGWSTMKDLRSRSLFYSTESENISSQRVAGRLGLRRIGTSLRIY